MARSTFVTNHGRVLVQIAQNPEITARKLADTFGITERTTRKIIADLTRENYILKRKNGRGLIYSINHNAKLRHNAVREITVGDFLEGIGVPGSSNRNSGVPTPVKRSLLRDLVIKYNQLKQKTKFIENIYTQLF